MKTDTRESKGMLMRERVEEGRQEMREGERKKENERETRERGTRDKRSCSR